MSYQLSRLDLVVNNATTQITVNTNPSTQSYINGDVVPQDNVIDIASTNNRFTNPDDTPAATILSINKANSLTNLTANELGTLNVPISATVEGNGLKNLITSYYEGITYTPQLLTCVGVNSTSTTIADLSSNNFTFTNNGAAVASNVGPFLSSYAYSSVLFNGTDQSLTTTVATGSSLDLATGAGNWTIEGWFYVTSIAAGSRSILWKFSATNPSYAFWINAATPQWIVGDGVGGVSASVNLSPIVANTWYHFALVRNGNTITPYMNGVSQTGATLISAMGNGAASTTLYIGAASDGRYFPGYISNVRIVKGSALYLGNFLPPANNFSAASVTTITTKVSATTTAYTKLTYLPLDINLYNSLKYTAPTGQTEVYDNALTVNSYITAATTNINVISSTKTMNVADRPDFYITGSDAPNILGTASSTVTNSLGGTFNGTSSNLTVTATNAGPLDLSTASSWTIEGWFYATSVTGSRSVFWKGGGGVNNPSYALWLNGATPQWIVGDGSNGGISQDLSAIIINTWYHFALVRNGSFVTAYINGIGSTPVAITSSGPTANSTLWIGAAVDGRYFSGYISGFRVVKGTAVYTKNFAILPQISLLLTTPNNTDYYKDSSSYSLSVTNTGSTSSNIAPTWASGTSGSSKFLGSSYLSIPGPNSSVTDLATGAPNWTVECWFRKDDITTEGAIFWKDGTSGTVNPSYGLWIQASAGAEGKPQWIVGNGGSGGAFQNMSTTIVPNTWYHFALVRDGSTLTAYLNGVADTPVSIGFTMSQQGASLRIGAAVDPSVRFGFGGYISNFRIVKGSALYTSNFTVPASPFTLPTLATAIANTSLLTLQSTTIVDNSLLANTITPVGVTTTIPYSSFLSSFSFTVPGAIVSTPNTPAFIRNTTKYNDPTQVEGYFNSFIPEHTGEEDRIQAWV